MKAKQTLLAMAALTLLSSTASAVDFGGYFRVGPGQKSDTDCYSGLMDGGTYRLGNECNTYGEFALSHKGKAGDVDYKALLMTNFYKSNNDIGDTKLGINQIYAEASGFDVAPAQTFWIGKRFYGRADVHMTDTFFVAMNGTGAGVDGIALGGAKLNLAVFRDDNTGTRLNADISDIATNPGGKLRVTATATKYGIDGGKSGFAISGQHNQELPGGGDNTFWLQYAQGSAYLNQNFGGAFNDSDTKSWRLVESPQWTKGKITGQGIFIYGQQKNSDGLGGTVKEKFMTLGGRLAYAVTKNFKMQGELGISSTKPDASDTRRITKLTIAPTLTVGEGYYDRPEFRVYWTGASWNDAYLAAQPQFGSDKSGSSFGVQVEIWF